MKIIDLFEVVAILIAIGFVFGSLYFLRAAVKNPKHTKENFKFFGLMWYCLAGLNFDVAVFRVIEGKKLIAIVGLIFTIATAIAGFLCRKIAKEIV